jgi:hypothetical protein
MSGHQTQRGSIGKELRALAPVSLACVVAIAASALRGVLWLGLTMPIYCLGAVAVGSLAMGHEYTNRTLGLLLSQPVSRRRLLFDKFFATASLLLVLFAAAAVFVLKVSGSATFSRHPAEWTASLVLPVLCGLFLAPWLTMVCRSAIAGIVFTIAIPGVLFAAGEIVGTVRFGPGDAADALIMSILWPGTLILCGAGAVATWLMFMHLEATEGAGSHVRLPRFFPSGPVETGALGLSRHSRLRLLIAKELRLQQMTCAVACLYVIAWALAMVAGRLDPGVKRLFNDATVLYSSLIALLAGSMASAEERQMRTLEPQLLLPIAASSQWTVKVGVALTLATGLGVGLPALLTGHATHIPGLLVPLPLVLPVVLLTIAALYVSSVSTSGLSAFLVSLPAVTISLMLIRLTGDWLTRAMAHMPVYVMRLVIFFTGRRGTTQAVAVLAAALLVALILRFALANHGSSDRSFKRVGIQLLGIGVTLTIGLALLMTLAVRQAAAFIHAR